MRPQHDPLGEQFRLEAEDAKKLLEYLGQNFLCPVRPTVKDVERVQALHASLLRLATAFEVRANEYEAAARERVLAAVQS